MLRRIVALGLWAYFAWYLAATLADIFGLPTAIGPAVGAAMSLYALYDWHRRDVAASLRTPPAGESVNRAVPTR